MTTKTVWPQEVTEVSTTALNQVGEIVNSPDGTKQYMYIQANGAIPIKSSVRLDPAVNDGVSVLVTANSGEVIVGVSVSTLALDEYGWILIRGDVLCKVIAAVASGSLLASSATNETLKLAVATDVDAGKGIVALEIGVAAGSLVKLL